MTGSETNLGAVAKVSTKGNKVSKESIRRCFVYDKRVRESCPFKKKKCCKYVLLPVWRGRA